MQRQHFGEDELRYTRKIIAESTLRVNYFVGTVRMNCGKIAEIPTRRPGVLGAQIRFGLLRPGHAPRIGDLELFWVV